MVDRRWPNNSEVLRPTRIRWIAVTLLLLPCALATLLMTAEESCLPEFDACYGQTAVDEECGERCMVCTDVRPAIQGHRKVRRDFKRLTLGISPSGNHVPLV